MARARKRTRKTRGGDGKSTRTVKLTTTSNETYGYEHGTSPRDNAVKYQTSQNSTQNSKNKTLGSTGGARKRRRGGAPGCRPTKTTVTQFSTPGPKVSPMDASSTSTSANTTSLNAGVAATNDCHATNSCGPPPPTKPCSGGGKKKRAKKTRHRRRKKAGSKTKKTKWGCMSGGKKRSSSKRGRTRKRRQSRRHRRR